MNGSPSEEPSMNTVPETLFQQRPAAEQMIWRLRTLASAGIFAESGTQTFSQTPLSATLCSTRAGGIVGVRDDVLGARVHAHP
ncbi:MAG: hypothetical protein H7A18_03095 [Sinobacteraceae bacterium]|nr:hypothetical protein [Nevskiaceae bacterium]